MQKLYCFVRIKIIKFRKLQGTLQGLIYTCNVKYNILKGSIFLLQPAYSAWLICLSDTCFVDVPALETCLDSAHARDENVSPRHRRLLRVSTPLERSFACRILHPSHPRNVTRIHPFDTTHTFLRNVTFALCRTTQPDWRSRFSGWSQDCVSDERAASMPYRYLYALEFIISARWFAPYNTPAAYRRQWLITRLVR